MTSSQKSFAMTRIQKGIWITELKYPGTNMFNIGGSCSVAKALTVPHLICAIEKTIREIQCLNFTLNNDSPPLLIQSEQKNIDVAFHDFSQSAQPQLAFQQWRQRCLSERINLNVCSYFFSVYKVTDSYHGFLIKVHHLVCDGVSMQNIIRRICENYDDIDSVAGVHLTADDQSYFLRLEDDYLSGAQYQRDKLFWQQALAGRIESSNFILGNRSISPRSMRAIYAIPAEVVSQVKQACSALGCTESLFYYAAVALMLSRFTDSECVSFGFPLHGRKKADLKRNAMTVSTVPVQIRVDESASFADLIKGAAEQNNRLYRHQKYDYTELVQDNRMLYSANALFDVSFNYANTHYDVQLAGQPLIVDDIAPGEQHYSIQFLFKALVNGEKTEIYCDYKTEEYERQQIDSTVESLLALLEAVSANPHRQLLTLAPLPQQDLHRITTAHLNAPPAESSVVSLFFAAAKENDARIAVIDSQQTLTYRALAQRVCDISAHLSSAGVEAGSRVAILLPKSAELVATLLAVMALGAAYIPLEKDMPQERIKYIVHDSECALVISCQQWAELLPSGIRWCDSAIFTSVVTKAALPDLALSCRPTTLAYLIYTSGSTGQPKGTLIRHAELVNYCQWAARQYYPHKSDVAAFYTPLTFDLTVTSLFPALFAGAAIKVYTENESFILNDIIQDGVATVVKCTPSHLRAIQNETVGRECAVKRFVVGGENLKTSVAKSTWHQFGGRVDILNEYGPTETVVGCMIHRFDPQKDVGSSVPIGEPIDNTQIYIIDRFGRHCAPYMKGEMIIAGNGVSAGYWNREEMMRQKFIRDKYYPQQRAYHSGDLAWRTASSGIIYSGRIDNQVKIRGHRIEIEEIEVKLLAHEAVQDGTILVDGVGSDTATIKAFVVLQSDASISAEDLKHYLADHLLPYMVPQSIQCVDEIPLTFNGKIDSTRLLALQPDEVVTANAQPMNTLERTVFEAFKRVLGVGQFSMYSDFYQAGGDSIKAIQLVTLLQKHGLAVTAKDVLQLPVPKSLCHLIASRVHQVKETPPAPTSFAPTPIIKWFGDLSLPRPEIYHQMLCVSLPQALGQDALASIFDLLVQAHPILNCVVKDNDLMLQVRQEEWPGIQRVAVGAPGQAVAVAEALLSQARWPEDALFQAVLLDGEQSVEQELMLLAHHLVIDGVSWHLLIADLTTLVEQHLQRQTLSLPAANNYYAQWVAFIDGDAHKVSDVERAFWQEQISATPLFDNQTRASESATLGLFSATLSDVTFARFTLLCTRLKIRPNELLFSLYTYALFRVFHQSEFTVEIEGIGRTSARCDIDLSRNIGWFTAVYPLKSSCKEDIFQHIRQTKRHIRQVNDNGIAWQAMRYSQGGERWQRPGNLPRFNYLGDFSDTHHQSAVNIRYIHPYAISAVENVYSDVLDFNIYWEGECKVSVSYVEQVITPKQLNAIVDNMANQINRLMELTPADAIQFYLSSDFPTISLTDSELKKLVFALPSS